MESHSPVRQRRHSRLADAIRVTQASALELVYRHDRWVLAAGLILAIALAWAWLLAGAGMGMGGIEMTRMSTGDAAYMEMPAMRPAQWSVRYGIVMFCMWWIMMIAMMLPSVAPVVLLATALNRRSDPERQPFGSSSAFIVGYLAGWAAFSVIAVVAQWWLAEFDLLSDMLVIKSRTLAASIMIIAGAWQFTPLKKSCLRQCQSPIQLLTGARRRQNSGAVLTGLNHGLYCLGCCWFLMLLLFVGGVMNLYWVAALTLYVWLEKAIPLRYHVSQVAGAGLMVGGLALLLL
jgi:predicted metal-binding membrane protein